PAYDARAAAGQAQDDLRQLEHRALFRVADVDRPVDVAFHHPHEAVDRVLDVAEAARLLAVTVDRERIAAQRLDDEVADDTAVARRQARAGAVEEGGRTGRTTPP